MDSRLWQLAPEYETQNFIHGVAIALMLEKKFHLFKFCHDSPISWCA